MLLCVVFKYTLATEMRFFGMNKDTFPGFSVNL